MNIVPFQPEHADQAAELFVAGFKRLRRSLKLLPKKLTEPARVAKKIRTLMEACPGFTALEDGRVTGYLGAWIVDEFRGTPRRGAYSPEWGHAAQEGRQAEIDRALYKHAAQAWFEAGCRVHALTLLASDPEAKESWFWNGFGLTCVDGIRSLDPVDVPTPVDYSLVMAAPSDAKKLAELEAEHWRHYPEPPTLMVANGANSPDELAEFLDRPDACAWIAWHEDEMAGYMRFEDQIDGAPEILSGPGVTGITGAYVRPAHRGRGLAPALLEAGLSWFEVQGYEACAVDFESFNPEAAAFWPKYFDIAALSVTRIPEREPGE